MRVSRSPALGAGASAILLASILAVHLVGAETPSPQVSYSGLQSLVQAATVASEYAQGVVGLASSSGLSVSSETSLMATGNASLAAAEATLNPGGNLTMGLSDVHAAMGNFTEASSSAEASLQEAGLMASTDVQAELGTLAALNGSTLQLSSVIEATCLNSPAGSPEASSFQQDCATGRSWVANATAELSTAASVLASANGTSVGGFAGAISQQVVQGASLLSQARTDIAGAQSELATLALQTYAQRGAAYVDGQLTPAIQAANASAKLQGALVAWYEADVSAFQSLSTSQSSSAGGVTSSAATVAGDISSVPMASVTSSVAAQQTTLAGDLSSLTSFSQQVASLPLPLGILSGLQADATAAEGSLNAYSSSLSAVSSSAGSFSGATVDGFSAYTSGFDSAGSTEGTDAAAFASSFSTLQSHLGAVAAEFPLISLLGTWVSSFAQLGTSESAGTAQVASSLAAADASAQTLGSGIAALSAQVQGASQMEVSSALQQNVSSVYSSEAQLLNSSALASLSTASASLQSDAQLATGFAASSQAILGTTLEGFAASSQTLGAQGDSLSSQATSTSASMSAASPFLTADLSARTGVVSSAASLVSQALAAFDSQQVVQGASLLSQASVELQAPV
jgi:hypothetical protein